MKIYKVPAGIKGVARDLSRWCKFAPWQASRDELFTAAEFRGLDVEIKPTYQFVRNRTEYNVPVADVQVLNR